MAKRKWFKQLAIGIGEIVKTDSEMDKQWKWLAEVGY